MAYDLFIGRTAQSSCLRLGTAARSLKRLMFGFREHRRCKVMFRFRVGDGLRVGDRLDRLLKKVKVWPMGCFVRIAAQRKAPDVWFQATMPRLSRWANLP